MAGAATRSSPGSGWSPASAKGRTRIGRRWTPPGGFQPVVDTERFAPYIVHPLVPLELDRQIPKNGDQRQMEAWQRIGTYAAGLALDGAGVKGNAELLGRMDMIVAAGGGERDRAVDEAILSALPHAAEPGRAAQRAADERSAADPVSRPALQPARRQHLDRAWRRRLVAHLHGRGSAGRGRGADRLRAHRGRPGRPLPGRRLVQCRAAGSPARIRARPAAAAARRSRRSVRGRRTRRRHGARLARLLPGDREPRPCRRRAARRRSRISPRSPRTAAGASPAQATANARRQLDAHAPASDPGRAAVLSGATRRRRPDRRRSARSWPGLRLPGARHRRRRSATRMEPSLPRQSRPGRDAPSRGEPCSARWNRRRSR